MDELGDNFDARVLEWKSDLLKTLDQVYLATMGIYVYPSYIIIMYDTQHFRHNNVYCDHELQHTESEQDLSCSDESDASSCDSDESDFECFLIRELQNEWNQDSSDSLLDGNSPMAPPYSPISVTTTEDGTTEGGTTKGGTTEGGTTEDGTTEDNDDVLSYTLGGDNLDKNVTPRNMRLDHQRKSLHYFNVCAFQDRVRTFDLAESHETVPTLNVQDFFTIF